MQTGNLQVLLYVDVTADKLQYLVDMSPLPGSCVLAH